MGAFAVLLILGAVGIGVIVFGGGGGGVRSPHRARRTDWRNRLPVGSVRVVVGPSGGSVWRVWIHNSFVATRRPSYLYLPRYRPGVRYPVVYLLHGFPGSPNTFVRDSRIATVADGLIRSRKLRAVIVVMPVAGKTITYDGEWGGVWEQFVVDDVLPWTETHLPTIRSPAGRAIGGLSAGGYGAVNTALHHPRLFATIEAWAGYFHPLRDGPFAHATPAELAANDPTLLLPRQAALLRQLHVRVFLAAGTQDPTDIARARQFAAVLSRLGISHVVVLRSGAHHNSFWRRILTPALAYTFPTQPQTHP